MRILIAAALLALPTLPATAQGVFISPPSFEEPALTGKRARVAREIEYLGFSRSDLRGLSNARVAAIDSALHSGDSQRRKQARVQSLLSGGGLLQGILDGQRGRQ